MAAKPVPAILNLMTIAIIGASGFLGTNLLAHLLHATDYSIVAIARHTSAIQVAPADATRVRCIDADIFDETDMVAALEGVQVAYFFVHMMGQANPDFYTQETIATNRFCAAAITAGVQRVIYMGGLGNDHEQLSEHLLSRHNTGTVLRENLPLVLEFRAAMIVGPGSISFDIIRNLVHKLPIMTLPRWSITLTQPIALPDALDYLTQAANVPLRHSEIVEIGGPRVMAYQDLYREYANFTGRHPFIVRIPFLPERVGGWWLNLFTPPGHAKIGRIMVHSMSNAMVVTHARSQELFPDIHPRPIEQAFANTAVIS